MRILIAVSALMYRESIAFSLQVRRPHFDVLLGSAHSLDGRADEFEHHMVVKDYTQATIRDVMVCVAEISYRDSMAAKIALADEVWFDEDLSRIKEAAKKHRLSALYTFAPATGLSGREICALTWDGLDLPERGRGSVRVSRAVKPPQPTGVPEGARPFSAS